MLGALIAWGVSQFSTEGVRAQLAKIDAEATARAGAPDWAGEYSRGAMTPIVVGIAPGAGYQFAAYACQGMMDAARGALQVEGTHVHLGPPWPFFWRSWDFELVRWGERRYLIEPERMPEFVRDVNCGREPRDQWSGIYFMRSADPRVRPLGQPELPAEWMGKLRPRIEGRVISASCTDEAGGEWEIDLDIGSDRGAEAAGWIWIVGPGSDGYGRGESTEVGAERSHALVYVDVVGRTPLVGWQVALELPEEP